MKFAALDSPDALAPLGILEAHTPQVFRAAWNARQYRRAFLAVYCDVVGAWLRVHIEGRPGRLGYLLLRGECPSDSDAAFVWRCVQSTLECHTESLGFARRAAEAAQDAVLGYSENAVFESSRAFGRIPRLSELAE